jgi:putative transposase
LDAIDTRLKEILKEVAVDVQAEIQEMETDQDHIHLLISCDPQFGIHQVVKRMKGRSSRLLRDEFPHLKSRIPSLWTNSYFVATVGGAPLSVIKQYIKDQQQV